MNELTLFMSILTKKYFMTERKYGKNIDVTLNLYFFHIVFFSITQIGTDLESFP